MPMAQRASKELAQLLTHDGSYGCRVKPTDELYNPWKLATKPFCRPCTPCNLPDLLTTDIAVDFVDTDSEVESKLSVSSIVSDDIDDRLF